MKFNVGDIITGTKDSPYPITNSDGKYEVICVFDDDHICVRVVEHIRADKVGTQHLVFSRFFVYAEGFAHWEGIFSMAYNQKTFDIENGVPVVEGVSVDSPCYKQLCAEHEEFLKNEKEKKV